MPKSQQVVDYLKKNPGFFDQHQELLAAMDFSNQTGVVPFHERQVQVLRDRQDVQQARLDLIVDTARSNQDLEHGLHRIAVKLLSLEGLDPEDPIQPALLVKSRFDVDDVAIFLSSRQPYIDPKIDYPSLCKRVAHLGSVCDDRVSSKLQIVLFSDASSVASCAFVPIVYQQNIFGVMVLGSKDKDQFQPGMGVRVLDRLGQLIGAYLAGRGLL